MSERLVSFRQITADVFVADHADSSEIWLRYHGARGYQVDNYLGRLGPSEINLDQGRFECFSHYRQDHRVPIDCSYQARPIDRGSARKEDTLRRGDAMHIIDWIGASIITPWSIRAIKYENFRFTSLEFSFTDDAEAGDFALRFA